ncbi:MAG: cytochrome c [Polyangia bacterium]
MNLGHVAIASLFFTVSVASADPATATLFQGRCAACHGKDGAGQTPAGKKLKVSDWTKTDKAKSMTDAQMEVVIEKGVKADGKVRMPGFATLTPEQRKALVAHVRTL